MQRNPYWPLKGPSFFSVLKFRRFVLPRCTKVDIGFGSNFAVRMASRRPNLPTKRASTWMIERSSTVLAADRNPSFSPLPNGFA